MVGRHPSSVLTWVDRQDLGQIQLVGYIRDEPRQMILWNPILQRGREKENLIQGAGAESLAHRTSIADCKPFNYNTVLSIQPDERSCIFEFLCKLSIAESLVSILHSCFSLFQEGRLAICEHQRQLMEELLAFPHYGLVALLFLGFDDSLLA